MAAVSGCTEGCYSEGVCHPELSSAKVSESFEYCHTDNGVISVLFEKLSGKDVSFVDMTARGNCFTPCSVIVYLSPSRVSTYGGWTP